MQTRPTPVDYADYRAYLRDMVAHLKGTTRSFSYRAFARRSGFSSVGFLKHVIEGERNLALASVGKVAKGLGLSEQEAAALELLVTLSQAPDDDTRTRLLRRLRASKLRRVLRDDEFELYSTWWAVPIRELLTLRDAPTNPAEIAERLWPRIKLSEAKRALTLLTRLGLLAQDAKGQLQIKRGTLETPPQVKSLAVRNYHRHMLERAAESLETVEIDARSVTSVTAKLTQQDYEAFCKRIDAFQDELLASLDGTEPSADDAEIYNISFALIPVTRRTES